MSLLLLLRHAKSGWAKPGMRDFDRPLDETGRADAEAIGAAMLGRGYLPDVVLCSTALRTRETLERISASIGIRDTVYVDALYSGDGGAYLDTIRLVGDAQTALLVGHNPMTEDIAIALSGGGSEGGMAALSRGFPTSGLAVVRFPGALRDAAPGKGCLEAFLSPHGF